MVNLVPDSEFRLARWTRDDVTLLCDDDPHGSWTMKIRIRDQRPELARFEGLSQKLSDVEYVASLDDEYMRLIQQKRTPHPRVHRGGFEKIDFTQPLKCCQWIVVDIAKFEPRITLSYSLPPVQWSKDRQRCCLLVSVNRDGPAGMKEVHTFDLKDAEAAVTCIGALRRRNACEGCGLSTASPLDVHCFWCWRERSPSAATLEAPEAMELAPKKIPMLTLLDGAIEVALDANCNEYFVRVARKPQGVYEDDFSAPAVFKTLASAVAWVKATLVLCSRCNAAVEYHICRGSQKICLDCKDRAGRLIASRAKAALANPNTILGRRRLLREAEELTKL